MARNLLIVAALAALLVGFGVVTGVTLLRPDAQAEPASTPGLLVSEPEPRLVGVRAPAALIVAPRDDDLITRLAALEEAIRLQGEQYAELSKRLEPAIQIIDMINAQRSGRAKGRPAAMEHAAIATSRNVISAQAQLQAMARVDTDNDGTGEYGGFLEMSGAVSGRMAKPLNPPVLSSAFRMISDSGEVGRSGYVFRIYLPASNGDGVAEDKLGFRAGDVDADLAETTWCMYAWPKVYGESGTRTFFVNQGGDVLSTDDAAYSGPGNGPGADAAFKSRSVVGKVALGSEGRDGNLWKQAN